MEELVGLGRSHVMVISIYMQVNQTPVYSEQSHFVAKSGKSEILSICAD